MIGFLIIGGGVPRYPKMNQKWSPREILGRSIQECLEDFNQKYISNMVEKVGRLLLQKLPPAYLRRS